MQAQELINISESLNKPSFSLSEIILIVRGRCADKGLLEEPGFTVEFASEHMIYDHAVRCIHGGLLAATHETATNKSGQIFTRHMVKPDDFLFWAIVEQTKGIYKIIADDIGLSLAKLFGDKQPKVIPRVIAYEISKKNEEIRQMMMRLKQNKNNSMDGRLITRAMTEMPELKDPINCYMKKGKGKVENRKDNLLKAVKLALIHLANSKEFVDSMTP